MAFVNYGIVAPTLTLKVQMELSDMDSARVVNYLMQATSFGTVTENVQSEAPNPAWSPDQENPLDPPAFISVQAWVSRPATPEEAVTAYAESVMNSIVNQAYQWDKQIAGQDAADKVPPITPIQPPAPVPSVA
jgi:hypothetical protein